MIVFPTIIFVLLYYTAVTDGKFRSDYDYMAVGKGWFKLHRVPATWHEAQLRCNLEGAVLASPSDVNLLEAMKLVMLNNNIHQCGVFTGIHATISRGDYFSIEGVPLSKIPISWAPNEPDNYENSEDCLMLQVNGSMADVRCTDVFPYICYKNKSPLVVTGCGTTDPDYQLDRRTGSCYKFHKVGQPWARAFMTCAAEGGYLSIINSDVEAQVLVDKFALYPDSAISAVIKDMASIGFYDWGERGTWRTIHGTTLEAAGYNRWLGNRPDNLTTGEFCGSVYRYGNLNDIWCDKNIAFICEKDPTSLVDEVDQKK